MLKKTNRILLQLFLTTLVLFAAGVCRAEQEDTTSVPKSGPYLLPAMSGWNSQITFGYLPAADVRKQNASVSLFDYRLRTVRTLVLDSAVRLTVGGEYRHKYIDASSAAALPKDLHALVLETGLSYRINQRSFVNIRALPGIYSDLKGLTSTDVKMPLLAMGSYSYENGITVIGGFIYRFGYHSMPLLPVVGLTYQPDPHWRIDLTAPRPGVTFISSQRLSFFLAGDFVNDEYGLHDDTVRAGSLTYRDYKILCGVDYLPANSAKLSAAVGYAFDRSIEFHDTTRQTLRLDDVPFVRLSLDLAW